MDIFHCIVYSLFTPQPAAGEQGEKRLCRNLAHWSGLLLGEMWWLELVLARSGALLVTTIIPSSPPARCWPRWKRDSETHIAALSAELGGPIQTFDLIWCFITSIILIFGRYILHILIISSNYILVFLQRFIHRITGSVKKMDILNNLFSIKNTH